MTVGKIFDLLDSFAPFNTAMEWDNVGLLIGDRTAEVFAAVVALDVTTPVINRAKETGANLIITHHPVIFHPIKSVVAGDIPYELIRNNISVISAHTNLDIAEGGVNDMLASKLALHDIKPFVNEDCVGRIGSLPQEMTAAQTAEYIKERLSSNIWFTDCGKKIRTLALVGGAGEDYCFDSRAADGYLTGEVRHNVYIDAQNAGIQIFTAGHHETEAVVLNMLTDRIKQEGVLAESFFSSGITKI